MTTARIELPPLMRDNFAQPARHRVFKGGRGSGKTRGLAIMSAVKVYQLAQAHHEGVWLCSREHLNSLDESSMAEVKVAISSVPFLAANFEVGEKFIRTKCGRISFAFAGLRHNLDSIKSKARILGNWTDEAESVSDVAWRKLIPTIREEGSENWISYNPESAESATHKRFIEGSPSNCIVTELNWRDNPRFPKVLDQERLDDLRLRPDTYDHVWEGGFLTRHDAQIMGGCFDVDEFEPESFWDGPYYGLDFGFSQDPTAMVQAYIHKRVLYIRREAGGVKLELDDTAQHLMDRIPELAKARIRADSARPESISYLRRHGLPGTTPVDKWPGSVEDGIAHIRSYERVIIHPDCPQTAREFRLYSYKVNNAGDVLNTIVDANNHYIDALRYAMAPLMTRGKPQFVVI